MLFSAGWLGLARGAKFFRIGMFLVDCHPDGSGRTCCFVRGQQGIGKRECASTRVSVQRTDANPGHQAVIADLTVPTFLQKT